MKLIDYVSGPETFYLGIQEDSNKVFVCRVFDDFTISHYDICLYSGRIREPEKVKELLRQKHKGEGLHKLCKEHGIEVTVLYQGMPSVIEAIADETEFHEFAETLNKKRVSEDIKAFMLGFPPFAKEKVTGEIVENELRTYLKEKRPEAVNSFRALERQCSNSIVSMCKLYLRICK